jgi:triosephosphate isomerase
MHSRHLETKMTPKIRPLVAGNWKMNGLAADIDQLAAMKHGLAGELSAETDALICVPATLLSRAKSALDGGNLQLGGQDCHSEAKGAHTGDVSAAMLKDAGASFVTVGHSERRADHGESSELVALKAQAAWAANLKAIICIGETREEREAGATLDVLSKQLAGSVPDAATASNSIIAYEPVWAIGTGLTPSVEDVAIAHKHIRDTLVGRFADGGSMRILYGGSVKPSNARELLAVANVDGALVGGASLKAGDFLGIADAYLSM